MKKFWLLIAAASVLVLASYWSKFNGDASLYLVYAQNIAHGYGWSFNPGVFSSGATSPLWPLVLALAFVFSHPELGAKIISFAVFILGIYVGRKALPKSFTSDAGLLFIFAFGFPFAAQNFEVGLTLCAMFLLLSGSPYGIMLLPLARPEGIVFSLWAIWKSKKRWAVLLLIPILAWWTFGRIRTGEISSSIMSRSDSPFGWDILNLRRYAFILIPPVVWWVATRVQAHQNDEKCTYSPFPGPQ